MKLRSFLIILATGAITLLLISAASFYWILSQSPLNLLKGGVNTYPSAAIFVPKQAPAMLSLVVNPDRLEALRQLGTPLGERWRSRIELTEIKQNLLAQTKLSYRKDIQPWLGEEVTLAITSLDFDRDPENGVQPGYLLVAATKDPELARQFLQLSLSKQAIEGKSDLVLEEYLGVKLIYQRPTETKGNYIFTTAVVGDRVLFANHPKVLRDALNNAQAVDLNLQNSSSYQQALQTIRQKRIGMAFVNLPALSAWIAKAPVPETPDIEQTLTVTLSSKPAGINAETALIGVSGEGNLKPALSEPVKALSYIPKQSIFTAAGVDLNGLWRQITQGIEPNSPLAELLNQTVVAIETPLGINLAEDIFSWVKGEYALALLSDPQSKQLDWLFLAEKSTDTSTDEAIEHLDNLATEAGLSTGNFPVRDLQVTAWTKLITTPKDSSVSLNADVRGAHATVGKYEIFGSSIESITSSLQARNSSLLQSQGFKDAITSLPKENDGYLYVDWSQGRSIFEQQAPVVRVLELAGQPFFERLRSLILSSQGSENGIRRASIFFNLGA